MHTLQRIPLFSHQSTENLPQTLADHEDVFREMCDGFIVFSWVVLTLEVFRGGLCLLLIVKSLTLIHRGLQRFKLCLRFWGTSWMSGNALLKSFWLASHSWGKGSLLFQVFSIHGWRLWFYRSDGNQAWVGLLILNSALKNKMRANCKRTGWMKRICSAKIGHFFKTL